MIATIEAFLVSLSTSIPIEIFSFIASFLEEIIAPIPSPLIAALIGSVAMSVGYGTIYGLIWLAFLMALGKTFACALIYWVMYFASTATEKKIQQYFNISTEALKKARSYFTGSVRDYILLIVIRATPFAPSTPISLIAGVVRAPFGFYTIATFFGTWIRSALFIFVGFGGYALIDDIFTPAQILVAIAILVVLGTFGYVLWMRQNLKKTK